MDRDAIQPVIGSIRASNVIKRGLETARGNYCYVISGDDYICDGNFFSNAIDILNKHPKCSSVIAQKYKLIWPDKTEKLVSNKRFCPVLYWSGAYNHISSFVFRKEIAKKNEQLQQEKLKLDLDWQRQLRQTELEMERQEKQKQIAIQKEKEEFVTSLRKEYENKLQFNFSIPEHFITEFRILTNEYLKGKTSKDHLEQNFTNCLNITLKEMLQTQEEKNKINEEEKRKLACKEVMSGFPEIKIAEKYNISLEELQELLKPLYKKETITESQKQMIIKYGIMLKVPVEYMAEYIPCSERMCNKIMEQNKNIKYTISENKPTTQVKEKVQIGRPRGAKKVINESKVLAKR